jgi:hypothetical protein
MTKLPQVPQDDLMDVMEMTQKIEKYISRTLKDQDQLLAISALISASVNSLWLQCKSFDEILYYRNMLMEVLDRSIHLMHSNGPDKPVS